MSSRFFEVSLDEQQHKFISLCSVTLMCAGFVDLQAVEGVILEVIREGYIGGGCIIRRLCLLCKSITCAGRTGTSTRMFSINAMMEVRT